MKADKTTAILALENSLPALEAWTIIPLKNPSKPIAYGCDSKLGLKNGQVLWPMRVAPQQ